MEKTQSIKKCPITNDEKYFSYLNLGKMPLVNNLSLTKEESLNCDKFELKLNYYPKSKLTALSEVVNPKTLYSNYLYKLDPKSLRSFFEDKKNNSLIVNNFGNVQDNEIIIFVTSLTGITFKEVKKIKTQMELLGKEFYGIVIIKD